MGLSRRRFLAASFSCAPALAFPRPAASQPLWPGARYTEAHRKRAVRRGLEALYRVALNQRHFQDHGSDLLWSFFSISRATADAEIKHRAWTMGQERARHWRRLNPHVVDGADAAQVWTYAYGSLAADSLEIRDERMKSDIQTAVARFGPADFLRFDPLAEAVPKDIPTTCRQCSSENGRGQVKCRSCGRALEMFDPYDLLCEALVTSYMGDSYGVTLGRTLPEVMQVLPKMRPYPDPARITYDQFSSVIYAITHVVYALNDYSRYRLNPQWLPQEFDYLKRHLNRSIKQRDAEIVGEYIDSLKSFGLTYDDPAIRTGVGFVMSQQNSDGSWGDSASGDIYDLYHTTWTRSAGSWTMPGPAKA